MATFEGLAGLQPFSASSGAYVKLSSDQLTSASRYVIHRSHTSTTRLYRQNECGADFYILLSGSVQTFWSDAVRGQEHFITLEPGEFSGEPNLLNPLRGGRCALGPSSAWHLRSEKVPLQYPRFIVTWELYELVL